MEGTLDTDAVVELRRYTLHPGARETLIELFERELVEPQQAVGMDVLGQFRDVDAPDHFVWLRGFRSMDIRGRALRDFYGGPVWARHRDAANATMIDSDDVLLLQPTAVAVDPPSSTATGVVIVTTYPLADDAEPAFRELFVEEIAQVLRAAGGCLRGVLRTEPGANEFPALPVREGESVIVTIATFSDLAAYDQADARLQAVDPTLRRCLRGEPHVARLIPTERSRQL